MRSAIRHRYLVPCILAAIVSVVHAQPTVKVFILSGQSNMGGGAPRGNDPAPSAGEVWYDYSSVGNPSSRTADWISMSNLIGQGVETTFGSSMKEAYPENQIALMKVFQGATPIAYWLPGGDGNAELALRIATVRQRLDDQVTAGDIAGYEWAGFVWFQGEQDAAGALSGSFAYADRLERLLAWVRTQTGVADLPCAVIRIWSYALRPSYAPQYPVRANVEHVRSAHVSVTRSDPRAEWVDTDDLPIKDGEPHYHRPAYVEGGRRAAQAYQNIVNDTNLPQSPYIDTIVVSDGALLVSWGYVRLSNAVTGERTCSKHGYTYTVSYGTSPDNLDQRITGLTENQVVLTGLANGTEYYVSVKVVDGTLEGDPSYARSATPAAVSLAPSLDAGWGRMLDFAAGGAIIDASYTATAAPTQIQWEKVSGPGSAEFSDPNALDPQVTVTLPGMYLCRLTATLDGAELSDTVFVRFRPKATQSSMSSGRWAYIGIDGTIDTTQVFHTNRDNEAWWELDFGTVVPLIDSVKLHNRGGSTASRLKDFYVFVSDEPFTSYSVEETRAQSGVWEYYHEGTPGSVLNVPVGCSGRFVRLQLSGRDYLHLSEIETFFGDDATPAGAVGMTPSAVRPLSVRPAGANAVRLAGTPGERVVIRTLDLHGRTVTQRTVVLGQEEYTLPRATLGDAHGVRLIRVNGADAQTTIRVVPPR